MIWQVIRTAKVILYEYRRPLSEWILLLSAIEWTLHQLMLGRKARRVFSALVAEDSEKLKLEPIHKAKLREQDKAIVEIQGGKT